MLSSDIGPTRPTLRPLLTRPLRLRDRRRRDTVACCLFALALSSGAAVATPTQAYDPARPVSVISASPPPSIVPQRAVAEGSTAAASLDLSDAWAALEAGDAAAALTLFEAALTASPERRDAALGRAEALSRLKRHDAADAAFATLAAQTPLDPDLRFRRGLAALRAGDPEGAISNLHFAAANRPGLALFRLRLGDALYGVGDAAGALDAYTAAAALLDRPSNEVSRAIGNAEFALGRFSDAEAAYGDALALDPRDAVALRFRGESRERLGRFDEALADYEGAVALGVDAPALWIARGRLKRAFGDRDAALADYRRALRQAPDFPPALQAAARALMDLGRTADAAPLIDRLLSASADDPTAESEALFLRGRMRLLGGDHVGAENDYTRLLQQRPRDAEAHYNRALARLGQGDVAGASEDFRETIRLRPNDAKALYAFGRAAAAQGLSAEAARAFELAESRVRELETLAADAADPRVAEAAIDARLSRGLALLALDRHDAALAEFDAVLTEAPDHPSALRRKAEALLRAGRPSTALIVAQALNDARPQDPLGRLVEAEALLAIGESEAARRALVRADALGGEGGAIARLTGAAWLIEAGRHARGDLAEIDALAAAISAFDAEIATSNSAPDSLIRRADAFVRLGRFEPALDDLDEAVRRRPNDPALRFERARVLSALGRCAEAIRDYDVGLSIGGVDGAAQSGRGACKWREGRVLSAVGDLVAGWF